MRVIALLAAYNERRFIDGCLADLDAHGIESYLIDNCSTDGTVELAEAWLGRGLIGIESFPRSKGDSFALRAQLWRKEELAGELEADWFIHMDPDEVRLPPSRGETLAQRLAAVDRDGFNAVNFTELTFLPTREEPDHDHPDFRRTLRTYYPFEPADRHQVTAWKATGDAVDLASFGGHRVAFPGLRVFPESFPMKHYLFLSVPHAIEKYVGCRYDQAEVRAGWHGWRASVTADDLRLPSRSELRLARSGAELDRSKPRRRHYVDLSPLVQEATPRVTSSSVPQPPVCVLGMSRSGTSLTTRILNVLGVELGGEGEMIEPHAGANPTGFWEHREMVELNEDILASFDRARLTPWLQPPPLPEGWQRDARLAPHRRAARVILQRSFAGLRRWGWKDPRSCLTLPFWQELIPEMRYVICVRDPRDVAASLDAREGIPREAGMRLWLLYMSRAIAHTEGKPRLFVSYESYFPEWRSQVLRLARFLGEPEVSDEQLSRVAGHLDEKLWRQRGAALDGGAAALDRETGELFDRLSAAASSS